MGYFLRGLVIALAVCLSTASAAVNYVEWKPVVKSTALNKNALYTAAVRTLTQAGYVFQINDRDSGVLVTEWKDYGMTDPLSQGRIRLAFHIVTDDNQLTVLLKCENVSAQGIRTTCDPAQRVPPEAVKEQGEIANSILREAEMLPQDSTSK